mgnify:CR=1 FL=1
MNKGFQRAKRVKATLYQLFLESIFIAEKDIRGFAITYDVATQSPLGILQNISNYCLGIGTGTRLYKIIPSRQVQIDRYILSHINNLHLIYMVQSYFPSFFWRTSYPVYIAW